jgi:NifB/MoaA-like Fe-S oxidoreductase
MRESLYFKDDDTRLSFLHGSFVTITNLKKEDLDKLEKFKKNIFDFFK